MPWTKVLGTVKDFICMLRRNKIMRDWEKFYKNNFNLNADFSKIYIPRCPNIGWRLLIILQGIGPELAFRKSQKILGSVTKFYDASLDDVIVENERDSKNGSYAIWVRNGKEADRIHKNKSANQVKAEKLLTETCLERLIHGLKYFRETGKHLDVKTATFCSGSWDSDGRVPCVCQIYSFDQDSILVTWHRRDSDDSNVRAREVVSC
jgi:hypothetical protein